MPTLIVSPRAEEDLEEIWAYVSDHAPEAADRLIDRLIDQFERLAVTPHAGRSRHDLLVDLRSFPIKNYLIFYQPVEDGVEIFRVLHGSRDLPDVFDQMIDEAE